MQKNLFLLLFLVLQVHMLLLLYILCFRVTCASFGFVGAFNYKELPKIYLKVERVTQEPGSNTHICIYIYTYVFIYVHASG